MMNMEKHINNIEFCIPPNWENDKLVKYAMYDLDIALTENADNPKGWHVFVEIAGFSDEEYSISLKDEGKINVLICCNTEIGLAYALFHIAKLIRIKRLETIQNQEYKKTPDMKLRLDFIHENPGEMPCESRYKCMEVLLKSGYNGVVVRNFASLILYDSYKIKLYIEGSYERELILKNRRRFRDQLEYMKGLHMKVFLYGDILTLPFTVITNGLDLFHDKHEEKNIPVYRECWEDDSINPLIPADELFCVGKQSVLEIYQTGLVELFEDFPEIDGIIVRTGENYVQSDPTLMGNNPLAGRCMHCRDLSDHDRHRLIISKTREITEKYNKLYIHRTWDFNGLHHLKQYYIEVTDEIEPSSRLMYSIKHTETDFWRYVGFNPCIGEGRHQQMMEFQCQREYEGKGAFPNYLGRIFKNGQSEGIREGSMEAGYQKGVRAVWSWSRGGGWNGPYIKDEVWVNANVYAFISLAWDTCADPVMIAREWAALEFGTTYDSPFTEGMASILIDSEEAVKKMFYVNEFCKNNYNPWGPNLFWSRDDDLTDRGIYEIARYLIQTKCVEKAIKEKIEAEELCQGMLDKLLSIESYSNCKTKYRHALNTIRYMHSLSKVIRSFFAAVLTYYQWLDGFEYNTSLGLEAMKYVLKWEEEWQYYQNEIPKLEGTASLYEDVGFGGMIHSMKSHLLHHTKLDCQGTHWGFASKNREKAFEKLF